MTQQKSQLSSKSRGLLETDKRGHGPFPHHLNTSETTK